MGTDPLYTVETSGFVVTFMLDEGDHPDTLEFNDAVVTLPDGTRWSATFATLSGLERVMEECSVNGVSLNGRYLKISDLVISRDPGAPAMVDVIQRLIDGEDVYGPFERVFEPLEPLDDSEPEDRADDRAGPADS